MVTTYEMARASLALDQELLTRSRRGCSAALDIEICGYPFTHSDQEEISSRGIEGVCELDTGIDKHQRPHLAPTVRFIAIGLNRTIPNNLHRWSPSNRQHWDQKVPFSSGMHSKGAKLRLLLPQMLFGRDSDCCLSLLLDNYQPEYVYLQVRLKMYSWFLAENGY
ncbi:hypothetical protein TNCV_1613141 [Trichonephila clavipes]|nr:hypothetical protein TNCV_1613141 [Trichonephila clavipes]